MTEQSKLYEDPYAEREKQKYENPVPSREFILQLLRGQQQPLDRAQIIHLFQLRDPQQIEGIRRRLKAMERDGQVVWIKGYYYPADQFDRKEGIISAYPDGFGFVIAEDGKEDIFLSPKEMRTLFHGDRVEARITSVDARGRRAGMISRVLERNTHTITGLLTFVSGYAQVMPDHKKIQQDIVIDPQDLCGAQEGQVVVAEITHYPTHKRKAQGRIIQVLGDHMKPGQEIEVSLRLHDIPHQWPEAVSTQIEMLADQVEIPAQQPYQDMTHIPFVTIDGEDAQDFDDAVFCVPTDDGWRLKVAIADVAHYVPLDSALDKEAQRRGTSVYFPGRVIPMLPEKLSNGLCSLQPGVDRLAMICDIAFDAKGNMREYEFYQAVIHSVARLTYTQVGNFLQGDEDALQNNLLPPHIDSLYQLYQLLAQQRQQRGAIDFDTIETRIIFGASKKIDRIVPVVRNEAHKLIEECMLAANVCAADFLLKHKKIALYRNHAGPSAEKLSDLRDILRLLGLMLAGGDEPQPADYNQLLQKIRDRDDFAMLQTTLLRSLSQAEYEAKNKGHFGLAYPAYAHFTSPIRRYPDLLVHRAIKSILYQQPYPYTEDAMQALGEQCSQAERRADEATQDVMDWLKCEYMLDKIGEEFSGIITTVTGFGFFVALDNIHIEGLVHVTSLHNDYYVFEPARQQMRGKNSGISYRIGAKVQVRVAAVSLDERKIDLVLLDSLRKQGKKMATRRASPAANPETQHFAATTETRERKPLTPDNHETAPPADKKPKPGKRSKRKISFKRRL